MAQRERPSKQGKRGTSSAAEKPVDPGDDARNEEAEKRNGEGIGRTSEARQQQNSAAPASKLRTLLTSDAARLGFGFGTAVAVFVVGWLTAQWQVLRLENELQVEESQTTRQTIVAEVTNDALREAAEWTKATFEKINNRVVKDWDQASEEQREERVRWLSETLIDAIPSAEGWAFEATIEKRNSLQDVNATRSR